MFVHEALKRIIVGSIGAALFSTSCLLAAAGPVKAETTLLHPAPFQSR